MKLWFTMGTAAELIKLFPLIYLADREKIEWSIFHTGQSNIHFFEQLSDFNLSLQKVHSPLKGQNDLKSARSAIRWFLQALLFNPKKASIKTSDGDFWIIHGDTFSTVVGVLWGKRLGLPTVHIEAGLRSHNIFSPFPEELCRKFVGRLATLHMAPNLEDLSHLAYRKDKRCIFHSHGNTLIDTYRFFAQEKFIQTDILPIKPHLLVNIHRVENLNNPLHIKVIMQTITKIAINANTVFLLMPNTELFFEKNPKIRDQLSQLGVKFMKRLPFSSFIQLLSQTDMMITDSGSNQEECFYLGIPCLLMRKHTERTEGLEQNCILSKFDTNIIDAFISNPRLFRRNPHSFSHSPSEQIFHFLKNYSNNLGEEQFSPFVV